MNGWSKYLFYYRRPVGKEEELLVFIWSSGPLEFFDASPAMQPFSYFQYRVRAQNSKGSVLSQWALAQTLEAKPQNMAPPTATTTGELKESHCNWYGCNVIRISNGPTCCALWQVHTQPIWNGVNQDNPTVSFPIIDWFTRSTNGTQHSTQLLLLLSLWR